MDKTVNGHITLDTYLVFDKAKVTNENSRLTNKLIYFDTYVYEFHRDLYSTSDSYAEAVLSLNKYIDALGEYAKDVIEQMFDSCTFDVTKTSYTSNIVVTPDGVARVFADVDIEFDGTNPRLQKSELGAEVRHSISAEFEDAHITYAKKYI